MEQSERVFNVRRLLGNGAIGAGYQDEYIDAALKSIEDQILGYINWETLPPQLENTLILMTVSYLKSAGLGSGEISAGPVASVNRGDVQTTFAVSAGAYRSAGTFNLGADGGEFFGWRQVLNPYRRLRW